MKNYNGRTLLHEACFNGVIEVVTYLLPFYVSHDINLNKLYDNFYDNPFTLACSKGFSKNCHDSVKIINGYERSTRYLILIYLLDCGVTIDIEAVIKRKKNSPLHWTIYYGDFASS